MEARIPGIRGLVAMLVLLAAVSAHAITTAETVAGMERTWAGLSSYSCHMHVYSRRGDETRDQDFNFMFRKPRLVRLKVTGSPDKGADIVYDRNGKVTGAERILGFRVRKGLRLRDGKLYDLRGTPFWQADLGTQIQEIRRTMSLPGATSAVAVDRADGGIALTVHYREENPRLHTGPHAYVDTWRLAGNTYVPLHRNLTEDGVVVEDVTVTELDLSPNLPESLFHL